MTAIQRRNVTGYVPELRRLVPAYLLKKGVKLIIPKSEIVSKVPAISAGYEWASWIYVHRWYFSFTFLAATLWMVWGWFFV